MTVHLMILGQSTKTSLDFLARNEEKFRFIQNVWKPDRLFNFPSTLKSGDRHPESLNQTDSHAFLGFFTQSTWMVLFVYPVFVLGWGLARTVPSSISCFNLCSHSGRLLAPSFNSIRLGSRKYTAQLSLPCMP